MTFPDSALHYHLRGAERYIVAALRPGTRNNHRTALKTYIGFMCHHGLNYLALTSDILCAYIHYLVGHYSNPMTIKNYISSLASVLKRLGLDTSCFNTINVLDFLSSIHSNVRYVPRRKLPVMSHVLKQLIFTISDDPEGPSLVFAVLIMYYTLLRQSNLGPRNKRAYDPTRHLTRQDVLIYTDCIVISVKWTKTHQGPTATSVAAPIIPGSDLCPVQAYNRMVHFSPTRVPLQALISFRDGSPIPISYLNKAWNNAAKRLGLPPRAYTLHSLRRGGASAAFISGAASLEDIKSHGLWTSSAVEVYLPNDPRRSEVYQYFKHNP